MKFLGALLCSLLFLVGGCEEQLPAKPTLQPTLEPTVPSGPAVEVTTIIVKMVSRPSDRERDFTVIHLDGSYMVYYDQESCVTDTEPYMYAQYNSVQHCEINEPNIILGMVNDQVWLDERLAPFKNYLSCIKGWIYLGVDSQGKNIWFVEMFGFPAFCE